MNANSSTILSRIARLATSGLFVVSVLGGAKPAQAMVDAPSGDWNFTLYKDDGCSGSYFYQAASTNYTLSVADLRTESFNDMASSWSLCNDTGKTAKVTITLYSDINYGGTAVAAANDVEVPTGLCLIQTTITPNDAISSFKVTATLY